MGLSDFCLWETEHEWVMEGFAESCLSRRREKQKQELKGPVQSGT